MTATEYRAGFSPAIRAEVRPPAVTLRVCPAIVIRNGWGACEVIENRIVVAAGAATIGGLSEPSALATNVAGRNAVAAPLFEGIEPVALLVCGGLVVGADGALVPLADAVLPPADDAFDPAPQPASGRTTAVVARTTAVAGRLIHQPSAADKFPRGVEMRPRGKRRPARLFEYDARHRRLWIHGQRCHHGAGGTLVALTAVLGLIGAQAAHEKPSSDSKRLLALILAGGALMVHDWKDRSIWFQRGRGARR